MSPLAVSLLAYLVAVVLLTVTPGVDTAMVLRASAADGRKGGFAATAGICLGCMIWGFGAAFGLTALLAASALAFTLVKWAGAAYLAWLGLKMILNPRDRFAEIAASDARGAPGGWSSFRRGLLTNLLNPKVGVFYITFLPQFIPPGYNVAATSLLLAGVQLLIGGAWLVVLVMLTASIGRLVRRPAVVRAMDRLTGVVLIAFGVRLALAEAH